MNKTRQHKAVGIPAATFLHHEMNESNTNFTNSQTGRNKNGSFNPKPVEGSPTVTNSHITWTEVVVVGMKGLLGPLIELRPPHPHWPSFRPEHHHHSDIGSHN